MKKLLFGSELLAYVSNLEKRIDALENGVVPTTRNYYTTAEVLKILGIGRTLLYSKIDAGVLKPRKVNGKLAFSKTFIDDLKLIG